ncbi:MAG: AAA family ATPase [Bacilli bacterium]|nr:AAA family ATPase [Bacilli bacterium]
MLILVGPSASGKTEAAKLLISKYNMKKLVTYTSRNMRPNEVQGVDYHFISVEDFEKKIKEDFFIEYVNYNGNYYGTSKEGLDSDKVVILEPTGLKHYLEVAKDLVKICYLRCPKEVRYQRMVVRGDSEEVINKRIDSDDVVFSKELELIATWTIDGYGESLEDMTNRIYNLYKDYID